MNVLGSVMLLVVLAYFAWGFVLFLALGSIYLKQPDREAFAEGLRRRSGRSPAWSALRLSLIWPCWYFRVLRSKH